MIASLLALALLATHARAGEPAHMVIVAGSAAGADAKLMSELQTPVVVNGEQVAKVDVAPFMGELFGYVFAAQGKEPVYEAHTNADLVLSAASAYFGTDVSGR